MLFCVFFLLFLIYFVLNVADQKHLLDIRTAITHLKLNKDFFFNESYAKDTLFLPDQAQIPVISMKKRWRYRGRRSECLVRIRRRVGNPPQSSVLLANVQSLEIKLDELRSRLSYQRDIKNCNILCFTESWLNNDTVNIQAAGVSARRQDRTTTSGKTRGCGVCLMISTIYQESFTYIFRSCLFTTTNGCWY